MLRKIKCWFEGHHFMIATFMQEAKAPFLIACVKCKKIMGTIEVKVNKSDEHKDMHNYY